MHELSLASGVLKIVEESAAREHFARVRRLTLTIGALAGVDEHALRFALQAIGRGTYLEDAEIAFETQPGIAWCLHCATSIPIASRLDLCPRCGSGGMVAAGGLDLRVKDLVVVDAVEAPTTPQA